MIGALVARSAIRKAFQALDDHDLPRFMSGWHEAGVFIYPGDIPESGVFEGKEAVEGWFRNFLEQYPKIHFDIQDIGVKNIFAVTGNNVVSVHWDIFLTNRNGREGKNSGVTVITVSGGKVRHVQDYIFDLGENFKLNWAHSK